MAQFRIDCKVADNCTECKFNFGQSCIAPRPFKIIRLLKAIGIALLCFGIIFIFVLGLTVYPKLGAGILLGLLFIFVVWRIYKDADFL